MISDGIENCLLYIDNFNPEKSKNPFAYFTQIIYYAFIRRIQKEKKQTYVKYKALENQELIDEIMQGPNGTPVKNNFMEFLQSNMDDFLADFEETQRKKKEKAKEKRDNKEPS
jgi:DNA-directed RNA polymerase specialized sigma24 family protein